MGVNLSDIIKRAEISLEGLFGKTVAIDAYNALYQFLSIIRGESGEPLMDKSGRVTSHLSGLLYRTANLIEKGLKPVYVFDGKPPSIKEAEIKQRMKIKEEARVKYEEALKRGNLAEARKYAQATSYLQDYMVEDAKKLLELLGVPYVQAPSEGEAQAAYMNMRGDVWAVASQDYDSLLFGAVRLVRNLTITGRRKLPGRNVYVEISPELIEAKKVISELGITREQLIDVAILVGTDYNPDGIKGIGPKKALKLIKEYGSLEKLPVIKSSQERDNLLAIRQYFIRPEVTDNYKIEWREPDVDRLVDFICGERDFSRDRVLGAVRKISEGISKMKTSTLDKFFL